MSKDNEKIINEVGELVEEAESILNAPIPDKRQVVQAGAKADQILASMGEYKRFFKRLS